MLQRMNDLSVQYNNGTQNTESQAALQAEFDQLQEEITRITDNTKFNGVALFDGADLAFQVGYDAADTITVTGADALAAVDTSTALHHRQHHGDRPRSPRSRPSVPRSVRSRTGSSTRSTP